MTEEKIKETMTWLDNNYIPLAAYHLNTDERIELGDAKNRKCRFCGGEKPNVKFKQLKHAIPELVGNKTLISMYECDTCNAHFSKMETHFSLFMWLYHTLAQVHGKEGVPTFKPNSKNDSRIDMTDNGLHIQVKDGEEELIELDEETMTLKFKSKRSYVPEVIHKCLTKMALSIMPETELSYFGETNKWLMESNKSETQTQHTSLPTFFLLYPGARPLWFPSVMLFKRKDNAKDNVPYCIFILAYSNFVFQIHLPLCEKDRIYEGRNDITVRRVPNPLDFEGIVPTTQIIDLASKEKIKNEEVNWNVQFGSLQGENYDPETGEVIATFEL